MKEKVMRTAELVRIRKVRNKPMYCQVWRDVDTGEQFVSYFVAQGSGKGCNLGKEVTPKKDGQ